MRLRLKTPLFTTIRLVILLCQPLRKKNAMSMAISYILRCRVSVFCNEHRLFQQLEIQSLFQGTKIRLVIAGAIVMFISKLTKLFRKPKNRIHFVETITGYEQFGLITIRWFWNLYEAEDGTRSSVKFHGGEIKPNRKIDYSAAARIDRWLHGGPPPTSSL